MFEGFTRRQVRTSGALINLVEGGQGLPLLLLHGYPQTHVMWHKIAPALAQHFTVICTDLRGYGDSEKPPSDATHATYSKRAIAQDQMEVMQTLGFEQFMVVGHDRGARVAQRLILDYSDRVQKAALLDIVPTQYIYQNLSKGLASAYYHWFFLVQPEPLPERLIGADPDFFLRHNLSRWSADPSAFSPEAMGEYLRCFRDPATIHATCEDYRAAASIDLEHDRMEGDRKLSCPILILWGAMGVMERNYNVLSIWQQYAQMIKGHALRCGHFLPEEAPQETLQALLPFLHEAP